MSLDDEILPYSQVDRPQWTDADHLCVVGDKQLELKENQIITESIENLYEGESNIDNGIYYYVIKKDDSETVYLFHKDNDRKDDNNNKTGHSSLITYEEYTRDFATSDDLDRGINKDPSCIVLYAGELIYKQKSADDDDDDSEMGFDFDDDFPGVLKWSNASGHFRPREQQANKVGFPMTRFVSQMSPFTDRESKEALKGGKRRKRRKRKKTKKSKKTKKVRKHQGITQTGGNAGRLRKGYRFSGKKLKSGMSEIVKAKKI